jgi:LmbE family N-acetylglucosaminyl deacetylase
MIETTGEEEPFGASEPAVVVALETGQSQVDPPPEPVPETALVVCAHPDDVDFGAAGTVASWTARGALVTYCIVTDGSAGAVDATVDSETLVVTRQREQREAAAAVGVEDVVYLGYPDGELEPSQAVRRDIVRLIRARRPDVVVCQSPERNYERIRASHPDHLAAGEATIRAVYPDARNPLAHRELLEAGYAPFEVPEVWMMASPTPDRHVDITDVFDRKLAALSCHKSQLKDSERLSGVLRGFAAATAERFGLPDGRLAEAFQVVDTR